MPSFSDEPREAPALLPPSSPAELTPVPSQARPTESSPKTEAPLRGTSGLKPDSNNRKGVGSFDLNEAAVFGDGGSNGEGCSRSQPSARTQPQKHDSDGPAEKDCNAANFECNICLDLSIEPVVTRCGHLYCWPCLHRWLDRQPAHRECPVCKGEILDDGVIPIYGRGGSAAKLVEKPGEGSAVEASVVPPRPHADRVESVRQQLRSSPHGVRFMQFNEIGFQPWDGEIAIEPWDDDEYGGDSMEFSAANAALNIWPPSDTLPLIFPVASYVVQMPVPITPVVFPPTPGLLNYSSSSMFSSNQGLQTYGTSAPMVPPTQQLQNFRPYSGSVGDTSLFPGASSTMYPPNHDSPSYMHQVGAAGRDGRSGIPAPSHMSTPNQELGNYYHLVGAFEDNRGGVTMPHSVHPPNAGNGRYSVGAPNVGNDRYSMGATGVYPMHLPNSELLNSRHNARATSADTASRSSIAAMLLGGDINDHSSRSSANNGASYRTIANNVATSRVRRAPFFHRLDDHSRNVRHRPF